MKKLLIAFICLWCATAATAQNIPYGKILNYKKSDLRQERYKYDSELNTWRLAKHNGLQATANVLSAVAGSTADIRPDKRDYEITVQMTAEDEIAWVKVVFHNEETLHKLLTFIADHGVNTLETHAGNTTKTQCEAEGYALELIQVNHNRQTVTSTLTHHKAKVLDDSYNTYTYTIYTGKEPWSEKIAKEQLKQLKRDSKGKKKRDVSDLM